MTVEVARKIGKSGEPWYVCNNEFNAATFAWHCVLSAALPCYGGYHMEREGMPLHDAVGINCKKGATTYNQGSGVKYMANGCILMTVCECYLT